MSTLRKIIIFNRILSAQVVIQSLLNDWRPQKIGIVPYLELLDENKNELFVVCSTVQETTQSNPGASFIQVRK